MNKFFLTAIVLFTLFILTGFSSAKEVTVVFDYPAGNDFSGIITVPDDANAYTAITTIAQNNSIGLDLDYYDGLGYFVNGINNVYSGQNEYWAFFVNNAYSSSEGMSTHIPNDKGIIGFAIVDFSFAETNFSITAKDFSNNPVADANIFIDSSNYPIGTTDQSGLFSKLIGLVSGIHTITLRKNTDYNSTQITANGSPQSATIFLNTQAPATQIQKALDWLLTNQKQTGEIGSHAVWGNAFALMALSLFNTYDNAKKKAIDYLLQNQHSDSGFSYPGFDSDALHSAVATIALIANDYNLSEFDKNLATTIDYMAGKQENDGGFGGWGASDVDTTSWGIMAFASASKTMPDKNNFTPIDYILGAQNNDGGFPYSSGQPSALDYTSEALLALASQNTQKNSSITKAILFINSKKDFNGCLTNIYLNSLAAMAMASFGEDSNALLKCIESNQLDDGGFGRNGQGNSVDTSLAIIALSGKTIPIKVLTAQDSNIIALNSIIKFVIKIKNTGNVTARNLSFQLEGVPTEWINTELSDTSIPELAPGASKELIVFAEMKATGTFEAKASISGKSLLTKAYSQTKSLSVEAAKLSVDLIVVQ